MVLALVESEKTNNPKGSDAQNVPNRMSRNGCSLRGDSGIRKNHDSSKAISRATPSTRRAMTKILVLKDTVREWSLLGAERPPMQLPITHGALRWNKGRIQSCGTHERQTERNYVPNGTGTGPTTGDHTPQVPP